MAIRKRCTLTRFTTVCVVIIFVMMFLWMFDTDSRVDTFCSDTFDTSSTAVYDIQDNSTTVSTKEHNWDIQQQYFTLRNERINPQNTRILMPAAHVCAERNKTFLLILCLSQYKNHDQRTAIRKTWGSVATRRQWPNVNATIDGVKLVFLLGRASTHMQNIVANDESLRFGDIVQADFVDSYKNLTIKVLMGLKWVITYCPNTEFVLKIDDDTFINLLNLVRYLKTFEVDGNGIIIGYVLGRAAVDRTSQKWAISKNIYPMKYFPPYVSGNAYVISGNILKRIHTSAEYMPYIFIEDAFITGIIRTMIGAAIHHCPEFAHHEERRPRFCSFQNSYSIASTKVAPALAITIWKTMYRRNVPNCRPRRINMQPLNLSEPFLF